MQVLQMTIHLPCNICICLDLWRPASVYSQTSSTFEPFVASLILGRTFLLTQWFTLFIQAFVSPCCSLLNFLEHRSHSTSWALSLCEVWASVFLSIPRLHMALHPSRPHCFCVPLALVHSIVVDVFPSESHPSIFSLFHREGVVRAASQTEWMWVFCSQACVQGRPTTPALLLWVFSAAVSVSPYLCLTSVIVIRSAHC